MGETLDSLLKGIASIGKMGIAATLTTMFLLPTASRAQEPTTEPASECQTSRECFDEGVKLCDLRKYTDAGRSFERALDIEVDQFRKGILEYNIGNVYERAGDPDRAIVYFQFYLREDIDALAILAKQRNKNFVPPTSGSVRQWVKGLEIYSAGKKAHSKGNYLEAVELYSQAIQTEISDTARLSLRRDIAISYEMAAQADLAIKNYDSYLQAAGETAADYIEIKQRVATLRQKLTSPKEAVPTEIPSPAVVVPPIPTVVPAVEEPSFWAQHRVSAILAGTSLASLVAGGGMRYAADAQLDDLKKSCAGTREGCSDGDIDSVATKYTASRWLFGIGIGLAVSAAVAYPLESVLHRSSAQEAKNTYILTPTGMAWRIKF